jgi:uncharacterized protein (TIGR03437 family)
LSAGTYIGNVIIASPNAANSPVTVQVTLTVEPQSSLALSPTALSFSATVGSSSPPAQVLSVSIVPGPDFENSVEGGPVVTVLTGNSWLSIGSTLPASTPPAACNYVGAGGLDYCIFPFPVLVNSAGLAVGIYSGSIIVLLPYGSNSPVTIPVTLTVLAQPTISGAVNAASFAKAASGQGSPVAPGSLVQIYATLPGASTANATAVPFPTSLGGASVTFNGLPASLTTVVSTGAFPFINAQVPFEVSTTAGPTVNVVLTVNEVSSPGIWQVPVVPVAPGIFTTTENGQGQAVLVNLAKLQIAAPANPIPRGGTAFFYATGLGALLPAVADGAASPASQAVATPIILVGGITAPVLYAGQAPGYPGVNQINIVIPENAPTGNDVPLQIQTADGTLTTSNLVTIAIE